MTGALDGLLVVALEQAVAAPMASARLADAGARVIKVERSEGDFARGYDRAAKGGSSYFVWLNRGKESLALNLKDADDLALLKRILGRADVFLQNLAPGAVGRLGLDPGDLRRERPDLVTCSISGYGSEGPYAHRKAYDLLVQAESGLASVTGRPEGPGRVGVSVCDIAAGLNAYAKILEALIGRGKSGQGRHIEISLFDAMAEWMTVPLLHAQYGDGPPQRVGLAHPSIAPYGVFSAADGAQVLISIQNEREWQRLCTEVLRAPDMIDDPRFASNVARVEHRTVLDARVAEVFAQLPEATLLKRLEAAGIAFGRMNDAADLGQHPVLRRLPVATPDGLLDLVAPPGWHEGKLGPVPAVDAHGAAIRKEFAG